MRTVSFQSVYEAILQRQGFDPLGDAVTHDTARAICKYINNRVATAWRYWDWPELMVTEERAYRQVWHDSIQYRRVGEDGLADEVYYIPTASYYEVNVGVPANPPVGTLPTNDVYWNPLDPVTTFVGRDQAGKRPIGTVTGVYRSNPALNGCCASDLCLNFRPSQKGITICDGPAKTVFIQYRLVEPTYTFVPFLIGKPYVVGDHVFYTGDGNCYLCIAAHSDHIPTDTDFWVLEPVPATFSTFVEAGAYADSLKETFAAGEDQVRLARAALINTEAQDSLEGEINDLCGQGQKHRYLKPHWSHVSWRYDGKLWWLNSGWCNSEPWLGNVVYELAAAPIISHAPPPPPPSQATMIYRPEIKFLHIVDGTPSLQAFPSKDLPLGTLIIITIGVEQQTWRVDAGIADAVDPGQISPSDYNVVSNGKHYRKVI